MRCCVAVFQYWLNFQMYRDLISHGRYFVDCKNGSKLTHRLQYNNNEKLQHSTFTNGQTRQKIKTTELIYTMDQMDQAEI